ncbi:MAG: hypothetical protein AAF909_12430 [Pseudomonadota bacterium]
MRVLMIGLKSSAVDFKKWPQLSVEKLEASFAAVRDGVRAAGHEPEWCLVDAERESAAAEVAASLKSFQPELVLVGAGVRTDPDHLLLFETILNLTVEHAPKAKFAFNSLPNDSVEAIQRWTE